MLQPRLENEQLNSLPNIVNTERSHTGFIITDRPDSTQLVDLHVYIIPKRVWKDGQHLAQNEAMNDAISAGFVRVPPNMKIRDLRRSIEQLCGTEDYFPRDFIFLRSVGRCMTIVKSKQEHELRVKNYRPPQSFAPEIYILEGRHEDYAHFSVPSPALSSRSYVFGGQRNENGYALSRPSQDYRHQSTRGVKHYPLMTNGNGKSSRLLSSEAQSWTKYTQISSDREESPKEFSKLKEEQERLRRRQAELERMRRAAEEKRARSEREDDERRRRQEQEDEERRRRQEREEEERRRRQERALAERDEDERRRRQEREDEERRRRQEKEDEERRRQEREDEERRRRQERALADRDEEERRLRQGRALTERDEEERRRRQGRALTERDEERRRQEQEEAAATTIQASYRGFRDRQEFKDRRQKANRLKLVKEDDEDRTTPNDQQSTSYYFRRQSILRQTPVNEEQQENRKSSSLKSSKSNYNDPEHEDIRNEISQISTRSHSIGSTSYSDSSNPRPREASVSDKERPDSFDSNASSLLSIENRRKNKPKDQHARSLDQETIDTAPFITDLSTNSPKDQNDSHDNDNNKNTNQSRKTSNEYLQKTKPKINSEEKFDYDEIELEKREAEAKRRKKLEEEEQKRKAKELEEQRRRELAKRQREDPESLRARLQELRARRLELEKIREEVIRQLKNIHNRITLRRKEARDMWKKRYFYEKKKTPPIEERVAALTGDLDQIHRKTVQTMDAEAKHALQIGYPKEAETGNFIFQITRNHHDIQSIRHQIEQAKLRLTTDVKLRNQAENECRLLRHELNQAKMNLNYIKSRSAV